MQRGNTGQCRGSAREAGAGGSGVFGKTGGTVNFVSGNCVVLKFRLVKAPVINPASAANNRLPRKDCLPGAIYVLLIINLHYKKWPESLCCRLCNHTAYPYVVPRMHIKCWKNKHYAACAIYLQVKILGILSNWQ